jgi:hypothetical protein
MRMILKHKRTIALFSLSIFLLLFVQSISFIKYKLYSESFKIIYKELKTLDNYENRNWIVNKNVMQYSVYTIYSQKSIYFDALVVLSPKIIKNSNEVKCVIKHGNKLVILSQFKLDEIKAPLFKLRCKLSKPEIFNDVSILHVSVIYESDINFSEDQNVLETINSDQIPYNGLQFQASTSINSSIGRKAGVVHCLNKLNVDYSNKTIRMKINNWIDMQKKIGTDYIQVYVEDIANDMVDRLSTKYEKFLNFVPHSRNYSVICGRLQKELNKEPKSLLFLRLLKMCNSTYEKLFLKTSFNSNIYELTSMNDCLLNYKYTYELLSNYDIDELIFPRNYKMDEHHSEYHSIFYSPSCNQDIRIFNQNYHIYNYSIKLFNEYNIRTTACLKFSYVEFLSHTESLGNFLNRLDDFVVNRKIGKIAYIDNQRQVTINFLLTDFDFLPAYDMLEIHKKISCYFNKDKIKIKIAAEFQRHLAIDLPSETGKSIINTKLAETLNFDKFCETYSSTAGMQQVNSNKGFVSHFNKEIHEILNDNDSDFYPFSRVVSDTEFSVFINNLYL